jgi:two-component system NtrC family sensor kinase
MDKKTNLTAAILETLEDGIYVMNQDLVVEYMNSAMIKQFGEGVGKKCHQILNQSEEKCPWCKSDEVLQGKSIRREVHVPLVDKTYYLIEIPLENEDGTHSKLSIYRDLTERKKREEMLRISEEGFKMLFEDIPSGVFIHARYDREGNVIGYEGLNVDLTQRKLMEKELQEAYDFMNQIIQSSPNSIMATDMTGNIMIWNRAAEETLGYSANEVIGKMNIRKIYPEGMARKVMQMLRSTEYGPKGRLRSYPMLWVRRDGEVIEGTLSAAMIYDAKGNEVASVGSFVDLRERLEMERALRKTQEQLLQSEKLAAMGRLTSQVAHELNNPLYGIMNTLELLKTEVSPQSKRRKILEMAHSETIRLSEMLRKMLSFSKPDQEKRQPVDINNILDEILLLHEKQLRELDIKIISDFADGLGWVNASKNQLRQVFLNMVANARDAMPTGGSLTVSTSDDADLVKIKITDTGMGIPEENLSKIFDSFFTTKDEVKGVGLGLSVCYGFIKDHGGDITVQSQVGSGTTFTITLPVHASDESMQETEV